MSHGWKASERVCSACNAELQQRPWWDDDVENGGACIGTSYRCLTCGDYFDE